MDGWVRARAEGKPVVIVVSDRVEVEQVCLWHGVLFGKVEHIQIDAVCIPHMFGVAGLTLCGSQLQVLFDGEPSTPGLVFDVGLGSFCGVAAECVIGWVGKWSRSVGRWVPDPSYVQPPPPPLRLSFPA